MAMRGALLTSNSYPNNGVKFTIDAHVAMGGQRLWTSLVVGNLWGKVGFIDDIASGYIYPFFEVWDLNTNTMLDQSKGSKKRSHTTRVFSMSVKHGTVWGFNINGQSLGTFDMGGPEANPHDSAVTVIEGDVDVVDTVTVYQMEVYQSGGLIAAPRANSVGNYGIKGHLQDNSFPIQQCSFLVCKDFPVLPEGTQLW